MPAPTGAARVVVDPNVLVSAAITRGTARSVVELAAGGSYVMVVCPHLVDELTVDLGRDRFLRWRTREQLDRFVADIVALADHTDDPDFVAAVTRDPNDDYLVALAVNSAAVICTGDSDLHDPELQVEVLTPADLVARFRPSTLPARDAPPRER
jgi:uncharacterized protein